MSLKYLLALAFFLTAISAKAQYHSVYINQGINSSLDSLSFPQLAINNTKSFSSKPAVIRLEQGDSLRLWIHNRTQDTLSLELEQHGSILVPAQDSSLLRSLPSARQQLLYVNTQFPNKKNFGAAALVHTDQQAQKHYFWCLQEFEKSKNEALDSGLVVNWSTYYPNAFFINGEAKPDIDLDPSAKVTGNVGDTILIHMANMGAAAHSLHFHGYHAEVIFSNLHPHHVGRSKDTFPLLPMECVSIRLVPHQPGEYPVHDHNLVAVSGNGIYPNGMFLTLVVQE